MGTAITLSSTEIGAVTVWVASSALQPSRCFLFTCCDMVAQYSETSLIMNTFCQTHIPAFCELCMMYSASTHPMCAYATFTHVGTSALVCRTLYVRFPHPVLIWCVPLSLYVASLLFTRIVPVDELPRSLQSWIHIRDQSWREALFWSPRHEPSQPVW